MPCTETAAYVPALRCDVMRATVLSVPPFPLAPFRDKGHERGERRRRLAAARVVQKRARKRRAPVVEHADQRARFDAIRERNPRRSARSRRRHGRRAAPGRDRSRSALPAAKPSRHGPPSRTPNPASRRCRSGCGCRRDRADPSGCLRPAMLRNIFARGHHRVALRRAERDRDHVLRQMLAVAHPGVKAFGDDIDERTVADDLQIDFGIRPQETARPSAPAPGRSPAAAH